jgi:hypothetical protein
MPYARSEAVQSTPPGDRGMRTAHARGLGEAKRQCLALGDGWFLAFEVRPEIAAGHCLPPLPAPSGAEPERWSAAMP